MEDLCQQYLAEVITIIMGGGQQQPIDDPQIKAVFQYSGQSFNDQGDLAACLRTPNMNFIEAQVNMNGISLFRGICLKDVCNAQFFTDHTDDLVALITQTVKIPIPPNSLFFIQYPIEHPSVDNTGFITISIILGIIFFLIIISILMNTFTKLKQKQILNQQQKVKRNKQQNDEIKLMQQLTLEDNYSLNQSSSSQSSQQQSQNEKDIETQNNFKVIHIEQNTKYSVLKTIIQCWDIKQNFKKAITVNARNTDLLPFDCIRVICFLQVVLGHQFFLRIFYYQNLSDFQIIQQSPFFLFMFSCFYSVDVFFLFGGFFVGYSISEPKILNNFKFKNPLKMVSSFFLAIINRVFRILPSYFIVLYITWQYINYLGNSPTWSEIQISSAFCEDDKWKKFLFIENLFDDMNQCLPQSWYLSNDMQMFICSVVLMIVYANHKRIGKIVILLTLAATVGIALYQSFKYEFLVVSQISVMSNPNWNQFYFKPWTRSPPYFLGLIFGVWYKEFSVGKQNQQNNLFLSKISNCLNISFWKWLIYAIGLALIMFLTFGPRSLQLNGVDYWNENLQHLIFGLSRVSYALGVVCILLPAVCGKSDLFVRIMSSKIFQFFAKLTFQGYLIHFSLMQINVWGSQDAIYLNIENVMFIFTAEVILILFVSFFMFIFIEIPFNNLANFIFKPEQSVKVEANQDFEKKPNQKVQQKIN